MAPPLFFEIVLFFSISWAPWSCFGPFWNRFGVIFGSILNRWSNVFRKIHKSRHPHPGLVGCAKRKEFPDSSPSTIKSSNCGSRTLKRPTTVKQMIARHEDVGSSKYLEQESWGNPRICGKCYVTPILKNGNLARTHRN